MKIYLIRNGRTGKLKDVQGSLCAFTTRTRARRHIDSMPPKCARVHKIEKAEILGPEPPARGATILRPFVLGLIDQLRAVMLRLEPGSDRGAMPGLPDDIVVAAALVSALAREHCRREKGAASFDQRPVRDRVRIIAEICGLPESVLTPAKSKGSEDANWEAP